MYTLAPEENLSDPPEDTSISPPTTFQSYLTLEEDSSVLHYVSYTLCIISIVLISWFDNIMS